MVNKYFTVEVVPTFDATSIAAFGADDVLFDWVGVQVPKGASRLVSVAVVMRGTDGGTQTARELDLYFAKSIKGVAPVSLGTVNATAAVKPYITNNIIGMANIDNAGDFGGSGFDYLQVAQTGSGAATSHIPAVVLEGESESGTNVGYDTLYVGCIAQGAIDFGTAVLTDDAVDVSGSNGTIDTLDGTACNLSFAVGDIIHATDDIILGEVASLDANSITFRFDGGTSANTVGAGYTVPADIAAWRIQNGAGAAGDLANNDELFNIHPMRILLSFEK